ncbi:hypothetical protein [Phytohabitans rumicis]|uniref:Uncharacterized protein n=1 Tax=Phytohabitans rumicis TaxID=1076125 RepID=A0A6V8LAC6_9ACTN|nr:hypothetical protein [Phytohabitans rumicis]GFJ92560.1 hypothetical protein Prum_062020 [Phytohabitans rumicis]
MRRLRKGLVAATMSLVVAAGVTVRPAPAAAAVPWTQIAVAVASYLFSNSGGGGSDLERAKQEIIAAINASRDAIITEIDRIASADVRACTEAATTLVNQIDLMDDFTLSVFALNAVECASRSTAYFDAVANKAEADRIGKLMGQIFAIAMVGFRKMGFPATDLLAQLIRGYEAVVVKLAPTCTENVLREYDDRGRLVTVEIQYTCVAYNGDSAFGSELYYLARLVTPPLDRAQVSADATRNTSRAVAMAALPQLRALQV